MGVLIFVVIFESVSSDLSHVVLSHVVYGCRVRPISCHWARFIPWQLTSAAHLQHKRNHDPLRRWSLNTRPDRVDLLAHQVSYSKFLHHNRIVLRPKHQAGNRQSLFLVI